MNQMKGVRIHALAEGTSIPINRAAGLVDRTNYQGARQVTVPSSRAVRVAVECTSPLFDGRSP